MAAPLIDVASLAELLGRTSPPAVLDVRWSLGGGAGREDYLADHIPGARFVDLDADLADPPGAGGRHPLPDSERLAATLRRLGVRNDTGVVVYDADNSTSAARAWWLLRRLGHPDVRVLDGGYAAWQRAGRPVETTPAEAADGDFAPGPPLVDAVEAGEVPLVASSGVLLDARDRERYLGEVEPVDPVAGHIPGAVSAPTRQNVSADGTFLDAGALRDRFTALGVAAEIAAGRPVAVYCGSGVTAAHEVLALEIAGFRAALYPGSWSGWITDPSRPVATGEH
jgi:thiosulfate/3-mercaptopyruvate sulfurtransferase